MSKVLMSIKTIHAEKILASIKGINLERFGVKSE